MIYKAFSVYKQAYKGLSRPTWWLSLVMLVNRSGTMVIPFMTIYLTQRLHYSITLAGYVMGLFGAGSIVGALIGGKLTDKTGFYPVQLITLSGGGILFIVLGQMQSYALICSVTFLLSVVNEAFRPANASAIAYYSTKENRVRSYSLNRLAINLGWAAGGALGGFLASHNYSLLFWVDGCTNITAALLLRLALSPAKSRISAADDFPGTADKIHTAFKDKTYLYFIALTMIFAICFFQFFTTMPVYFSQELHLPIVFIGIIMAMNGLVIAFFEMILVFKLEGRQKDTLYISYGVLAGGLSFFVLYLFHSYSSLVAVTSMIFITFGEMLSMPFMNSFWVSRSSALNRGQYASLYTISFAAAQVLGPTLGAQVVQLYGFRFLWGTITAICLINGVLFRFLDKTEKPALTA